MYRSAPLFQLQVVKIMLCPQFLSCLLFLVMALGKTERNSDTLSQVIIREQASMIKHCMSNVCNRYTYYPHRPDKPNSKPIVAFSAYPSKDLQKIAKYTKVVFGSIRTNIGNAYNPNTGIFTAPTDGVYAFHMAITVAPQKYTVIYMQVSGIYKAFVYGNARNYSNWYSVSQSYVTDLKMGDNVNLATGNTVAEYVHVYSTFTGYRL